MIPNPDVRDVYLVPQALQAEGLDELVCDAARAPEVPQADLGEWLELDERIGAQRGRRSRSRSSAST